VRKSVRRLGPTGGGKKGRYLCLLKREFGLTPDFFAEFFGRHPGDTFESHTGAVDALAAASAKRQPAPVTSMRRQHLVSHLNTNVESG
jgi:hypothetical protein